MRIRDIPNDVFDTIGEISDFDLARHKNSVDARAQTFDVDPIMNLEIYVRSDEHGHDFIRPVAPVEGHGFDERVLPKRLEEPVLFPVLHGLPKQCGNSATSASLHSIIAVDVFREIDVARFTLKNA